MNQKLTGKRIRADRVSVPGGQSSPAAAGAARATRSRPTAGGHRSRGAVGTGVRGAGNAAMSSAAPADANTQGV
ncbi:MAG: hypothetical protein QOE44_1862 [Solirubrobacteraceae bacterium]|jgi:hypothetical protein|nr:hypothetical protein [Solirubrobacteraceae bacterium]